MFWRVAILCIGCLIVTACDPGPNGFGTAPAGMSQEAWDAQVAARREAQREFHRGPRGGMTGR